MNKSFIALAVCTALLTACTTANNSTHKNQTASQTTAQSQMTQKHAYTITEHKIQLPNSQEIYGKLYRPNDLTGKQPIIIYSHGLGGNYEILENFAKALAEKGITGYAFDFHGGGEKSQSSGKTTDMTVLTEVDDLTNIISTVKTWDFVDSSKVILLGESQGGAVSALTASEMPDEIAGLMTFYPAYAMVDDSKAKYPNINEIPAVTRYFGIIDLGRQYFIDAQNLNPYAKIGRYNKPMLLVHGNADNIVNIKYSEQASKVYPQVTYKVIDGAGHGFNEKNHFEQALGYVETYLKQNGLMK